MPFSCTNYQFLLSSLFSWFLAFTTLVILFVFTLYQNSYVIGRDYWWHKHDVLLKAFSNNHFSRVRRSHSGFTLIETMLALMIFSVLVLLFATAIPVAHRASHVNGQYAQAISIAQHKIDEIRATRAGRLSYDELSPLIVDETPATSPYSFVNIDNVGDYLANPTATIAVDDKTYTDMTKVTVKITWNPTPYSSKRSELTLVAWVSILGD